MEPSSVDPALLDRFLAGECSPAEVELVRQWLSSHAAEAKYLDAVRDILGRSGSAGAALGSNTDSAWDRLARDTVEAERNAERLPPPLRLTAGARAEPRGARRILASPRLRTAAVITAVVGVGSLWLHRKPVAPVTSPVSAVPAVREYATARGQRLELRLPDGTRAMLAPESRLQVPHDFAAINRDLRLEGEAYFEVTHDERKPFRVHAGNAVAHDLGTRFVVRAYRGARAVQVVVAQGKVGLDPAGAPTGSGPVLGRGELGRVDSAGAVSTGGANLAIALAWTRGELVFKDASLSEVVTELGRWYDLDIKVADSTLRRSRLTLTIGRGAAPEALEAVALLIGARYEMHGQAVTFSAKTAAH